MGKKFAIPCYHGVLTDHFGHCEQFAIVDVNDNNEVVGSKMIEPPVHQPGLYPRWLQEEFQVQTVLAGGIGSKARELFEKNGIEVVAGVPADSPEALVKTYLSGLLQDDKNRCDHH